MKQNKFFWIRLKPEFANLDIYKSVNNYKPTEWFIAEKNTMTNHEYYIGNGFIYEEQTKTYHQVLLGAPIIEISNHEITRPYTDNELLELYAQEDEINKLFNIL